MTNNTIPYRRTLPEHISREITDAPTHTNATTHKLSKCESSRESHTLALMNIMYSFREQAQVSLTHSPTFQPHKLFACPTTYSPRTSD